MPFESSCLPNIRRRSRWLKILPNDCPRKPFCLFALSRTVLFRAPWIFFVLWENHGSRFSDKRVTMAVCPADKRYGFYAFFEVFSKKLRIDTHNQAAMSSFFRLSFVFVSRSRGICRIIDTDQCSSPAGSIKTIRMSADESAIPVSLKRPANFIVKTTIGSRSSPCR